MFKINKQVPIENLITRQMTFWDTSKKQFPVKKIGVYPNLTISRQAGSNGTCLAQKISSRLSWKVYDQEIVEYISNNTHVHKNMVELFDEKTRREMDNLMATLMNSHTLNNEMYLRHLIKILVALGQHGCAIILGRGGNFILPDNMAFKVRFIENIDDRLKNLEEFDETQKWTLKTLKDNDHQQENYIHRFFGEKIDNPVHYDLVINLSKTDLKTAEEIIINGLASKFKVSEAELHIAD